MERGRKRPGKGEGFLRTVMVATPCCSSLWRGTTAKGRGSMAAPLLLARRLLSSSLRGGSSPPPCAAAPLLLARRLLSVAWDDGAGADRWWRQQRSMVAAAEIDDGAVGFVSIGNWGGREGSRGAVKSQV
jgi:hypothetical protein